MSKKIKLILSGSGMLYPCFAGAINRLDEAGYEIEEVCGVSGGSIIASALASGYTSGAKLLDLIKQTLPGKNKLIDLSIISLFSSWGLIKGEKIEKMLEKYMVADFTKTKIPLHVVATDVSRKEQRIFNAQTAKSMPLAKAIRASMAIPLVFTPLTWGGEYYVDGGWVSNFPVDVFDKADNVVGIMFESSSHHFNKINSFKDYIMGLIDTPVSANVDEDIEDAATAQIMTIVSKHPHLNFDASDSDVDDMVEEGRKAAEKWLMAQKQ